MASLAMIAPVGAGILFLFALMLIAMLTMFWIVVWCFFGFRHRTHKDPETVKKQTAKFFVAVLAVMFLFPPLAEVGAWQPAEPFNPLISARDRSHYGSIPSYQWLGAIFSEEPIPSNHIIHSGTHRLVAKRWQIDWIILAGQTLLLGLFCLPYLRAVKVDVN
ncbi:hypothetical protein DTL21_09410 [Bremerella cremea]|uniref:Uncharacterized protein n=1 Tax=Blastopirellula marina TaxID=124 RepID=A0A2S8FVB6_9BACT|nr:MULTISPECIES: hypothetical protein [Pirellulaceae]PQO36126.1 hypothetical protein C5Y83_09405 [Blastopirellula marina]RCS48803.1 hypothetical protein DTL21_09410 [Bremerella cremea]